jgi:hypothetical protein
LVILLVGAAAVPLLRLGGDLYATQFTEPSKAGALVERNPFPDDQEVAWYYGPISGPRWYAWHADRPVRHFQVEEATDSEALVLVKHNDGDGLDDLEAVDQEGSYDLVTVGALTRTLGVDSSQSG